MVGHFPFAFEMCRGERGARGVVHVELCVVGACVPTDEVVEQVVGEGSGGTAVGATGDVAPAVVAAGVHLAAVARTGGDRVSDILF